MSEKKLLEGYCKADVWTSSGNWVQSHQCSRKAKVDGYCKQHHPDAKKARDEASMKKFNDESDARIRAAARAPFARVLEYMDGLDLSSITREEIEERSKNA